MKRITKKNPPQKEKNLKMPNSLPPEKPTAEMPQAFLKKESNIHG